MRIEKQTHTMLQHLLRRNFLCIILVLFISNLEAQTDLDFLKEIEKKAQELKKDSTEYQKFKKIEDGYFARREKDIRMNMHVIFLPRLATINAPLAYYHIRLKENPDRLYYYLDAISKSDDIENRQKYLLYIKSKKSEYDPNEDIYQWEKLIVRAGNAKWANDHLSSHDILASEDKEKNIGQF